MVGARHIDRRIDHSIDRRDVDVIRAPMYDDDQDDDEGRLDRS